MALKKRCRFVNICRSRCKRELHIHALTDGKVSLKSGVRGEGRSADVCQLPSNMKTPSRIHAVTCTVTPRLPEKPPTWALLFTPTQPGKVTPSSRASLVWFWVSLWGGQLWHWCRGTEERQRVRSGAPGARGWLPLNECPREVTGLIENRLQGEGKAFGLRLAPWPTVQRRPWQLWKPTYLFAALWRERAEQLSE